MDNLYSSFYLYKKYEIIGDELIDLGITSIDADGTQELVVKSECDPACGCPPPEPIYRWVQTEDTVCIATEYRWTESGYTCIGYDKYQNNIKEESIDGGITWSVVIPEEYSASTLIEYNSEDCGYVPPFEGKYRLVLNDSTVVTGACDNTSAITSGEVASQYSGSVVSATIGQCVTELGSYAFKSCSLLSAITIPNGVTTIGERCFDSCHGITSLTLPNSVVAINDSAFRHMHGLTQLNIPSGLTTIPNMCFNDCTALSSVTIPSNITRISGSAFSYCSALKEVYCESTTPATLGINVFNNASSDLVIYVPCGYVDTYKAASRWSTYASRIQPNPSCIVYRWTESGYTCIGYDKYQNNIKEVSTDGGETWSVVIPEEYSASTLVEANSIACGYIPPTPIGGKYALVLEDLSTVSGECDSTSAITSNEIPKQYGNGVISAIIGNCVTTIGQFAFDYCYYLQNCIIGSAVTTIGVNAFHLCRSLSNIVIPDSVTTINYMAFQGCSGLTSVTLGSGLISIDNNAFYGCSSLSGINIPDSVTQIHGSAFQGCSSLRNVVIGNGVTSIDQYAFTGCTSLTSVTLGSAVTYIGNSAFGDCSGLTSMTFPNGLTEIDNRAFYNCSSLTSVTIPNTVTRIGKASFNYCTSLRKINIPNGITGVSEFCKDCISLTSVTIPNSVTYIGYFCINCSSLTSVALPNNLAQIEYNSFAGCTSLTSITIPSTVTSIGDYAFDNCTGLVSMICLPSTPPTLTSYTSFANTTFQIYVPASSVNAYKTARIWASFADRIQEISNT